VQFLLSVQCKMSYGEIKYLLYKQLQAEVSNLFKMCLPYTSCTPDIQAVTTGPHISGHLNFI